MNRATFQERLKKRTLLSDGPLGRILAAGSAADGPGPGLPEMLGIQDGERLKSLHLESLEAGADLLLTNTFAANRTSLAPLGAAGQLPAMIHASMKAAREARQAHPAPGEEGALIGFVLGPLAASVHPHGNLPFGLALESYREVIGLALKEGPDLFVLEAMPDLQMVKTALMSVRELAPDVPVAVQMAFEALGRTAAGTTPATLLAVARSLGADLVGASGQLNPVEMMPVAKMLGRLTDLPLIIQPNAIKSGAARSGKIRPNEFAAQAKALLELPVGIIGCSGAPAPHYPAHLRRVVRRHRPQYPERGQRLLLGSETRDLEVSATRGLAMVKAWRSGTARGLHEGLSRPWDTSIQAAEILAPASRGEEARFLRETIPPLQKATGRPLLIQTDSRRGIEAALEVTLGRPLIWGAWLGKPSMERVVPLALRYGAAVVAVTMSDQHPPASAQDRVKCGDELIEELISRGLSQESIVIDPVVSEIGSKASDSLFPLSAAAQLKDHWGLPILIRLGRLTRGPDSGRAGLEAAYLAMAAAAGADLFVGDFDFPPLRQAALAAAYLTGRDPGGRRYRANTAALMEARGRRDESRPAERRDAPRPPAWSDAPRSAGRGAESRPPRRDESRSPARRDESRPPGRRPSSPPGRGRPPAGSNRPKPRGGERRD